MELNAVNDTRQAGLSRLLADPGTKRTGVVDLTAPLSAATPSPELPSLEEVSAYNEPGPYWKHHNIHTGEHIVPAGSPPHPRMGVRSTDPCQRAAGSSFAPGGTTAPKTVNAS